MRAFHWAGRWAGTMHLSHRYNRRPDAAYVAMHGGDGEEARRALWLYRFTPRPEADSDAWFAEALVDQYGPGLPSEALSDEQRERLRRWQEGPLKLPAERIARIEAAYRELMARYRAWRAGVAP